MQDISIKIFPKAKTDLDEIWISIAQTDFLRADQFIASIEARMSQLSKFPESGVARVDLFPKIRMLVEGQYLVFYKFEDWTVIILRIVHGARDLGALELG